MNTHTHTHDVRRFQTDGDLPASSASSSSSAAPHHSAVPFYNVVRQLLQMEYSAYLREDSSKWHCPAAMTTMCATINYRVFLFLCFINILTRTPHTHSVFLSCEDIPVQLFVDSLMTFTASVCVSGVFFKLSRACCHYNNVCSVHTTSHHTLPSDRWWEGRCPALNAELWLL